MITHLNNFLEAIEAKLPEVCSDKHLIEHLPDIFKSSCNLCRMRARGQTPPYFHVSPHIHYLRGDVICWLRSRYQGEKKAISQEAQKKPSMSGQNLRKGAKSR